VDDKSGGVEYFTVGTGKEIIQPGEDPLDPDLPGNLRLDY
jgi:hypothetical protein